MAITTGQIAPDATVFKYPREAVRLSSLRGRKHVLLFFPLAFTSVCTTEMCTMAEDFSEYEKLGVAIYGLSVDSPYVNRKFAESCNARFAILSDFNKEASTAYGVLRPALGELKGVSERAVFVIDEQGVVRYAWVGETPGLLPNFDEIKAAVAE